MAGLCLVSGCNKGSANPLGSTALEEEVIAVYKGLYRHPCSGHWFTEVNGDRTFFASSEWESGNFETDVPLRYHRAVADRTAFLHDPAGTG
ncbi:MAG: hypothetical protein SH848_13650 [Saprospiraceae bacterium]|nr:hypothetical protein [Saprospiraceae bacterium]MDZ4704972.1 hypothetical protein [Saprospiraceae bacterium]